MRVFIITEGSSKIGLGHITRCSSLYQVFLEKNILPTLIVNGDNSIKPLLDGINHEIIDWINNQEKLFSLIEKADIAIIDSYLAEPELYEKICETVNLLVCIDDYNRITYPKGIVVNGTLNAEEIKYPKKQDVVYLLGVQYIPLRKEFWLKEEKKIKERIKNVILIFGGSDIENLTPKILNFLTLNFPDINKKVIIGNGYQNAELIEQNKDSKTELFYNLNAEELKKVMMDSDIAISCGGQTLYELASVGVPTIGICVGKDQIINLKNWERKGFVELLGWFDNADLLQKMRKSIKKLMNFSDRERAAKTGYSQVDGQGARKIINKVLDNVR